MCAVEMYYFLQYNNTNSNIIFQEELQMKGLKRKIIEQVHY